MARSSNGSSPCLTAPLPAFQKHHASDEIKRRTCPSSRPEKQAGWKILPCSWRSKNRREWFRGRTGPSCAAVIRSPGSFPPGKSRSRRAAYFPPVPLLPPVAKAARLRQRAGHPYHRGYPDLCRLTTAQMPGRNPELFYMDEEGKPTSSRAYHRITFSPTGQLWGNPIYKLGSSPADWLRLVDRAHPPRSSCSTSCASIISAVCRLLGNSRRDADRRSGSLGARARVSLFEAIRDALGGCRSSPKIWARSPQT
jgi:hypothetical protein